jgi:hypothetical protein
LKGFFGSPFFALPGRNSIGNSERRGRIGADNGSENRLLFRKFFRRVDGDSGFAENFARNRESSSKRHCLTEAFPRIRGSRSPFVSSRGSHGADSTMSSLKAGSTSNGACNQTNRQHFPRTAS